MNAPNRPNTLWPVGTPVTFLDAWGKNPIAGKIVRHYGEIGVIVEDAKGVVDSGPTGRIVGDPPAELDLEEMLA